MKKFMLDCQRVTFRAGNGEILQRLWPTALIFPGAPEKVTLKMFITYKNKMREFYLILCNSMQFYSMYFDVIYIVKNKVVKK